MRSERAGGMSLALGVLCLAVPAPAMDRGAGAPARPVADGRLDPGPPAKDPKEKIEPAPAWSRPARAAGTPVGRTPAMAGDLVAVPLGALESAGRASLLEASLERGELLAFFRAAREERVGDVKYFFTGGFFRTDDAQLRHLTRGRHGFLYWHYGRSPEVLYLAPTGIHSALGDFTGSKVLHYLGSNPKEELVYFGDGTCGGVENAFAAPGSARSGKDFLQWQQPTPAPIQRVFPGCAGDFWIQGEHGLHYVQPGGRWRLGPLPLAPAPWTGIRGLACARDMTLVAIGPELDEFHIVIDGDQLISRRLAGARPHSVANGPDGQVWITLEGLDCCLVVDTRKRDFSAIQLPEAAGPRGLGALALGPDGNMWVALTRLGAIGRVTPEGKLRTFRLLPGDVPLELVPTPDGLLFTLERSDRIGYIRALAAEAGAGAGAGPDEAKADWAGPAYKPRPAREKALGKAERWALHEARMRRVAERERERAAAGDKAVPAAVAAGAGERKQAAPPAEPTKGPRADLAAQGVCLDPADLRHILNHHAHGCALPDKGQFAASHSTPDAMARLLARGLADSGAIGRIMDGSGRCYTKCAAEKVGWYCAHGGGLVPADHFVVVTARSWNPQLRDYDHDVITAYPVHPNW